MLTAKPNASTPSALHPSILLHPSFHKDMDEAKAKNLLNNPNAQGNFLFIMGKQNNVVLVYKALYKGSGKTEIRTLALNYSYDKNQNSVRLSHSSLGTFTNLSAAAEKLPSYLNDFVIGSFNPVPIISNISKTRSQWKQSGALQPVPTDLFKYILKFIDIENLYKLRPVSKAWCAIVEEYMPTFFKAKDVLMADLKQQRKKQVNIIFDAIQQKISPDREGHGDVNKLLYHNGSTISQPTWYGSLTIICHVDTTFYKGSVRINNARGSIELLRGELKTSDIGFAHSNVNGTLELANIDIQEATGEIYNQLEIICKLGKNPLVEDVDADRILRRP